MVKEGCFVLLLFFSFTFVQRRENGLDFEKKYLAVEFYFKPWLTLIYQATSMHTVYAHGHYARHVWKKKLVKQAKKKKNNTALVKFTLREKICLAKGRTLVRSYLKKENYVRFWSKRNSVVKDSCKVQFISSSFNSNFHIKYQQK